MAGRSPYYCDRHADQEIAPGRACPQCQAVGPVHERTYRGHLPAGYPGPAAAGDLVALVHAGEGLWLRVMMERFDSEPWKVSMTRLDSWLHNNAELILGALRQAAGLAAYPGPWPLQNFSEAQPTAEDLTRAEARLTHVPTAEERVLAKHPPLPAAPAPPPPTAEDAQLALGALASQPARTRRAGTTTEGEHADDQD